MPAAWKIIATTRRLGDDPNFALQKEYLLVAFADQNAALEALHIRRPDLEGAELELKGEAAEWLIDWLDVTDGQILSIAVVR